MYTMEWSSSCPLYQVRCEQAHRELGETPIIMGKKWVHSLTLMSRVADHVIFLITLYDIIFQWWSHHDENVYIEHEFRVKSLILPLQTLMSWSEELCSEPYASLMECNWNFDIMMVKIWYAGKVITDASEAIVSTNLAQCFLQSHYQLQQWEIRGKTTFNQVSIT